MQINEFHIIFYLSKISRQFYDFYFLNVSDSMLLILLNMKSWQ